MLAGVNGESCASICCKRTMSYGSALIGITLLVIGILAVAKCTPFASFAHSSAIGGCGIVAGFIILSLSIYYILSNSCKSSEAYVQYLPSSQLQKKPSAVDALEKFLGQSLTHLPIEDYPGSIETYTTHLRSKAIEQFADTPQLVNLINEGSSCVLCIPYLKNNNNEKCILIVFAEKTTTTSGWRAYFKNNATLKSTRRDQQNDIKKLIQALLKNENYTIGLNTYQPY